MNTGREDDDKKQEPSTPAIVTTYGTISSNTLPLPTMVFSADGHSYNNDISQGVSKVLVHEPLQIQINQEEAEQNDIVDSPEEPLSVQPYFIISSTINEKDPAIKAKKIVEKFNQHNQGPKALTESNILTFWRAKRVARFEFLLAHHNFQPELATDSPHLLTATSSLFDWTFHSEILRYHQLSQPFFGDYGRYVLQVRVGEYAKVIKDGEYLLFDEGVHIIASADVVFDIDTDFIKKSEEHIEHGGIHVLRVPAGKLAKVEKGSRARFFPARKEAYMFNDASFKFDGYVNANEKYIEYRNLKYISPGVNEVAVVRHKGEVQSISSRADGKPIILSLPTDTFEGMVSLELQILEYPSETTKSKKQKEKFLSPDEDINYSYFQTADAFKIGIKTSIEYKIINPLMVVQQGIAISKIAEHVENLTTDILRRFIKTYEWPNILNSNNSSRNNTSVAVTPNVIHETNMSATPPSMNTIEDALAFELTLRLGERGMEFLNLNFQIHNTVDNLARLAFSFWRASASAVNAAGQQSQHPLASSDAGSSNSIRYYNNRQT